MVQQYYNSSGASYLGRFLDDTQGYGSLQVPTVGYDIHHQLE